MHALPFLIPVFPYVGDYAGACALQSRGRLCAGRQGTALGQPRVGAAAQEVAEDAVGGWVRPLRLLSSPVPEPAVAEGLLLSRIIIRPVEGCQ